MQVTRLSYIPYRGIEARWLRLRTCPIWECYAGCNTRQWPLKKVPRSQSLSSLSRLPESSLAPAPCLDRKVTQSSLSGVSRNLSRAQLCLHQHRPAALCEEAWRLTRGSDTQPGNTEGCEGSKCCGGRKASGLRKRGF